MATVFGMEWEGNGGTAEEGYFIGTLLAIGKYDVCGPSLILDKEDDPKHVLRDLLTRLTQTGQCRWLSVRGFESDCLLLPKELTMLAMHKYGLKRSILPASKDIYYHPLNDAIYTASSAFQRSFLRALFDFCASVCVAETKALICLGYDDLVLLQMIRSLLGVFGVSSDIVGEEDALIVTMQNMGQFRYAIDFRQYESRRLLKQACIDFGL